MSDSSEIRLPPAGTEVLHTILANFDGGLYTVDRDGLFTFVNDFIARSSGFPAEAFIGRSYLELVRPEDRDRVRRNFELVLSGERVPPYELAYITARGEEMWVEVATAPLVRDGEIIGGLGLSHNIQRRKLAERALRESEANYRALVDNLPHGVAILRGSTVVFATEPLARMLGLESAEQLLGIDSFAFAGERLQSEGRERLERRLRGDLDMPNTYTTVLKRANGVDFHAELHVDVTTFRAEPALQVLVTDISERLRLEEQIRHAQKMEAIGNLAGGIAHDFNNLLTGILATASMLRRREEIRSAAELIEKSALQAATLTRQLLGFARRDQPLLRPTDVHDTIRDVVLLFERTSDKRIAVTTALEARDSLVRGDAGQLQQVFMNLYLNARDAMPQGGPLHVTSANVEVCVPESADTAALAPGSYVEVRVSDRGTGIEDGIREHVFDPFFTTKPTGEGCGMGLAVAYGIVRNHEGSIRFESEPGAGTTFTVRLPLWSGAAKASAPRREQEVTGHGTLLLVDDEEVVRETGKMLLASLGYEVITAASAGQALELYRDQGGGIDLVILDYAMPGRNGEECFRELQRIDPDVRVLLSSGLGLDAVASRLSDFPTVSFLAKPYDVAALSAAVASALGRASESKHVR